jgi:hypothetical protein
MSQTCVMLLVAIAVIVCSGCGGPIVQARTFPISTYERHLDSLIAHHVRAPRDPARHVTVPIGARTDARRAFVIDFLVLVSKQNTSRRALEQVTDALSLSSVAIDGKSYVSLPSRGWYDYCSPSFMLRRVPASVAPHRFLGARDGADVFVFEQAYNGMLPPGAYNITVTTDSSSTGVSLHNSAIQNSPMQTAFSLFSASH